MALSDYSTTASSNGNVLTGIDIAENCLPSNLNNAQRQVMADLATDLARANGSQDGLATGVSFAMPRGFIGMWSGSLAAIPAGWAICDGTNSTPDLTDRFIVATGTTYTANGATGGQDSFTIAEANVPQHSHDSGTLAGTAESAGAHTHSYTDIYPTSANSENGSFNQPLGFSSTATSSKTTGSAGAHTHTVDINSGSTGTYGSATPTAIDNRPAYYALAFIMKL